ncbi:MAG: DUF305 domain-containing protein [Chloroflexi bacterium]|nr:DUF305 domain-containing protein [Chloroflexota bacterium]
MKRILLALCCVVLFGAFTANAQVLSPARLERSEVRFLEGMSDHHQMAVDMANACLAKAQTPSVVELCQAVINAQTPEIEQMKVWLAEWYNIDYSVMSMDSMGAGSGMDATGGMMGMMSEHMAHMHGMMGEMGSMDGMMGHMSDMMGHMSEMMGHMSGMMGGMMGGMGDMGGGMSGMGGMNHANPATPDHSAHSNMNSRATDPAMMMGMFAGFNRLEGVEFEIAWLESMIDHHNDALRMSERLLARGTVHEELAAFAQAIIDAQTAEIELMESIIAELSA